MAWMRIWTGDVVGRGTLYEFGLVEQCGRMNGKPLKACTPRYLCKCWDDPVGRVVATAFRLVPIHGRLLTPFWDCRMTESVGYD